MLSFLHLFFLCAIRASHDAPALNKGNGVIYSLWLNSSIEFFAWKRDLLDAFDCDVTLFILLSLYPSLSLSFHDFYDVLFSTDLLLLQPFSCVKLFCLHLILSYLIFFHLTLSYPNLIDLFTCYLYIFSSAYLISFFNPHLRCTHPSSSAYLKKSHYTPQITHQQPSSILLLTPLLSSVWLSDSIPAYWGSLHGSPV